MNRAAFLDRDGVINYDSNYVYKTDNFHFMPGIFELCEELQKRRYLIIVITNQAGIARGYYTENDFHALTRWMNLQFLKRGIQITDVYFCPHHPEFGLNEYKKECNCRKPNPGMILKASNDHAIDLSKSLIIGDKMSDIIAGIRADVGTRILYCPDSKQVNRDDQIENKYHVIENFREVGDLIVE